MRAGQVVKDSLDCLLVGNARVCCETGDSGDCKSNIRTSGKGGPVECPNSLTIRLIAHDCVLSRGCGGLFCCEANGRVHGG